MNEREKNTVQTRQRGKKTEYVNKMKQRKNEKIPASQIPKVYIRAGTEVHSLQ